MSRSLTLLMALASTVALLPACGGGGDDAAPAPAPTTPAPPTGGTPGSTLATEANARILATEADAALTAAEQRNLLPGLPGGVETSIACPGGGSVSYDFPTTLAAGTTYAITYNNCSYASGYAFNGSYQIRYSSFGSATSFSYTATYDLRYTGPGLNYTLAGTQTCTASSGTVSCTYSDGRREWGTGFSYSGGRLTGSYSFTDTTLGTLTYSFSNFTATGGTVSVTGSGGFTATVTRTGANTYSVVINGSSPIVITISR